MGQCPEEASSTGAGVEKSAFKYGAQSQPSGAHLDVASLGVPSEIYTHIIQRVPILDPSQGTESVDCLGALP